MKTICKHLIIIIISLFSSKAYTNSFNTIFTDSCFRYDFELIGNYKSVMVVHKQSKLLPKWAGNPNYLIDDLNYGTYRFSLKTIKNNNVIFSQGFSPLFQEYQTTDEAKLRTKSFYQAIFFPKPKIDVVFIIENRNEKNNWQLIFSDTLKTNNYFVINELPAQYDKVSITKNGNPSFSIDIAILAEGYRKEEMNKFIDDAKRLTKSLLTALPFSKHSDKFNVTAIKIPSSESGTDIPGKKIYKNTALNSHFYTFDSERYLTTSDMKSIYDALDNVPFDQIYVLVNSEKYGGGGFYNFLNLCTSDNEKSPFVFIHEFGHGFAGLADEYYTSSTSFEQFYRTSIEPWEPNITTLIQFENKWKKLIDTKTPIPTPRQEKYSNKIGAFEGGGYVEKGVYSPMLTCWMKEEKAGRFCNVCEQSIEKMIRRYTE